MSESNSSLYLLQWSRAFPGRDLIFDGAAVTLVRYNGGSRYHAAFASLALAVEAIERFRVDWVRAPLGSSEKSWERRKRAGRTLKDRGRAV